VEAKQRNRSGGSEVVKAKREGEVMEAKVATRSETPVSPLRIAAHYRACSNAAEYVWEDDVSM
jgi:hypothetical protein